MTTIRRLVDNYFLFRYQDADFITRQKIRILSIMLITTAVLLVFLYSYHLFMDRPVSIFVMRSFGLICCLLVLGMIRKGYFSLAGHVILTALFVTVWSVMFLDSGELISKTDTIALAICTFSSCALVLDKKKGSILIYWLINTILLGIFSYHIFKTFDLDYRLACEFFLDNFVAFFFVVILSYQVISINNRALIKATESIQTAEREALKNKHLTASLEMKVNHRTKELLKNNDELQKEIVERKKAEARLREAQQQLVANAHKAGMSEMASDTLHNVGNVLNSIKTSAHLINESAKLRPDRDYSQACDLIRENQGRLGLFFTGDPTGEKLVDYLLKLDQEFKQIFAQIESNAKRLNQKIETVAEVIVAQQTYAGAISPIESAELIDIIEDSLDVLADLISSLNIRIARDFHPVPTVRIQKTKLLHALVNLFKNAVQAMGETDPDQRLLQIKVFKEADSVMAEVRDTGCGIEAENLEKVFSHGYSTKKSGFGFGLHSCANYLNEMGASITARSDGIDRGATFTIRFRQ